MASYLSLLPAGLAVHVKGLLMTCSAKMYDVSHQKWKRSYEPKPAGDLLALADDYDKDMHYYERQMSKDVSFAESSSWYYLLQLLEREGGWERLLHQIPTFREKKRDIIKACEMFHGHISPGDYEPRYPRVFYRTLSKKLQNGVPRRHDRKRYEALWAYYKEWLKSSFYQ